jgi:putative hydrolase of the HAD superfamily
MPIEPPAPPIAAIVIDWAGTITVPMLDMVSGAARELGFGAENLTKAFHALGGYVSDPDSIFHRAERGEVDDDDLRAHLETLAEGASRFFESEAPSIFHAPNRPEMIALLDELAESEVLVILATNNFVTGHEILASRYLDSGLVGAIVNSALVGVRKPDPRFFRLIYDTFDLDPAQVLVVDDQQANLEIAADLGSAVLLVGSDTAAAVEDIRQRIQPT